VPTSLREAVEECVRQNRPTEAVAQLARLMAANPSAADASFVVARLREIQPVRNTTKRRLAILRSFTIEPLLPFLRARSLLAGLDLGVHLGGFNAYAQELLDPASSLYQFAPDDVFVAVRTADLVPSLWSPFGDVALGPPQAAVEEAVANYRSWASTLRQHSSANLIFHTLELPATAVNGVADAWLKEGQRQAIQAINDGLRQLTRDFPGTYVLDYDGLMARHGRLRWHDEAKWLTMRMPIAADCWSHLADEYLRLLHPLSGKVAKVLVTDLDNTLWGGVIGEDGMTGIRLGIEFPGAAHRALQQALLDLSRRGILLAICSKNNLGDALEVLEKHPDMLLRPQHFAAMRVNWQPKSANLVEIARELNLGLDAVAFLDDSPIERQLVQTDLPAVHVLDLPPEPLHYAQLIRNCPLFERLSFSAEDRDRTRIYGEQQLRNDLERRVSSVHDFYWSLAMRAFVEPATPHTIPRIAQLTQKTNQFNLTTRRFTDQDIVRISNDPATRVLSLRLIDRLGDNGLVGVAILHLEKDVATLETFLLSCRVLGRTVETAFLRCLVDVARQAGAARLAAWFRPTSKNVPAQDFLPTHGFRVVRRQQTDVLWELSLAAGAFPETPWIECSHPKEAA
jgi:FkbH-like protein